ncbi:MAG: hypothetical protein WB723_16105 [Candidatus Acidiferrales bacterium]
MLEHEDVRADERWSLKQTRPLGRTALQQDVPPGFPEWRWAPPVSPQQKALYCPGPLEALLLMVQARPQDARQAFSPQSPLLASPLRQQLPSPLVLQNAFAQAPHVRDRASSNASSFP